MTWTMKPIAPPKIVAIATDKYLTPTHASQDSDLPCCPPKYGQDFTFGKGRAAPDGQSVGTSESMLKALMQRLLSEFAHGDKTGMAKRLFDKFLAKQGRVYYFEDQALNRAADNHSNIQHFCKAALGAPYPWGIPPATGKTRIHQALQAAGWDIAKLNAPTDLGVPAFNQGEKYTYLGLGDSTGDFANGLGVMVNGVQHAYVLATDYAHVPEMNHYFINLKFYFYDVFGLDDDDLDEYGASNLLGSTAGVGITAWWQLQHQFGYAPLVTRITVLRSYAVPTI